MENKVDLIEKYLLGKMSVLEQEEFKSLLKEDSGLLKEFMLRKDIYSAIAEEDVMELRNCLKEITGSKRKSKIRKLNPFIVTTVAACVIILIVVSGIFITQNKTKDQNLFSRYYEKYPSIINSRSSLESEKERIFLEAFQAYEEDRFTYAAEIIQSLLKEDDSNYLLMFYLSVCEMENNNYKKAERYLHILIENKTHIFWEQAHWYLALNYLKQGKKQKSIEVLKYIINQDMAKSDEADSIINSLI